MRIGQQFLYTSRAPWSGPCPNCGRRKALTRKYRGNLPCTDHNLARGVEVGTYRAEIVAIRLDVNSQFGGTIDYEIREVISVVDPLPGTNGRHFEQGGMIASHFLKGLASGEFTLIETVH